MLHQTYKPYWILYPMQEELSSFSNNAWLYVTGDVVRNGGSPLGGYGESFLSFSLQTINAYSHCFWVFSHAEFEDSSDCIKYSNLYASIVKCVTGCSVSKPGLMISNNNEVNFQPPTPTVFEPQSLSPVTPSVLNDIAYLTDMVWSLSATSREQYIIVFEYLAEIRKSALFISEQALWSFLEHRWASNKNNSSHFSSLDGLLQAVYPDKDMRKEKKAWKDKIFSIGVDLGKEYDEKHLRNMLAHGKHMSLQDGWSKSQWMTFIDVHKELMQLVIRGIKIDLERVSDKGFISKAMK